MFTIKKILCPTDFSEPSYVGLKTANDLAAHFSAELILVHVVTPFHYPGPPGAVGTLGFNPAPYFEEMVEASEKSLTEVARNKISPDLSARTTLLKGNAVDQIVNLAQSEKVDMIVTATHGWTGWRRFISGSVAERVVRHATCPVLTVPAPEGAQEE
ncbi:MAG: universal stress protein [Deltaproteobacteria bacterium]|nr:universal stress protein [Deltaproteobacteria bacterium]